MTVDGSLAFFRYADAAFVRQLFETIPQHQRLPEHLGFDTLDAVELVAEFEAALARAE